MIFRLMLLITSVVRSNALAESDRLHEYEIRNHTWPPLPEEYIPNTEGWRSLIRRRLEQVESIPDISDRYNGYMKTIYTGLIAPNFTEHGWGLTRVPEELISELRANLQIGLKDPDKYFSYENVGVNILEFEEKEESHARPLFYWQEELNKKVLHDLLPLHQAWAGVELVPNNAYGLRIYRNSSNLLMHIDKMQTHIISGILHVDHDPESKPWPLVIEDFNGNVNEVILTPGDLLLYESSKCIHGRPHHFNGSYYTSVFLHYYPKTWDAKRVESETHYRVPPQWKEANTRKSQEELVIIKTSVKEPECLHGWCSLKGSTRYNGPADEGFIISSEGKEKIVYTEIGVDTSGSSGSDEL